MHAVWHVFASMPELTLASPVLDWETDSCEARGPRYGHAASSSGASTGARTGFVKGVNFNLCSPLRSAHLGRCCCSHVSALHDGESEHCAQTQCGAECLACKL